MIQAVYVFAKDSMPSAFMVSLASTLPDEDGMLRLVAPMTIPGSTVVIDRVDADACYAPDDTLVLTINQLAGRLLEIHREAMVVLETYGQPINQLKEPADKQRQWH